MCAKRVLVSCVHQCGHGAGLDTSYRYPVAILQLWWFLLVGLHDIAVYLPENRCGKGIGKKLILENVLERRLV